MLRPAGVILYALAVDQVHDHEELVVKPAGPAVMATGLYAGTTLADDGKPVLLLDPPGIAARAGVSFERRDAERDEAGAAAAQQAGIPSLLFKTCAGDKAILPLSAIERIETLPEAIRLSGGRLHVAVGDSILPLEGCGAAASGGPASNHAADRRRRPDSVRLAKSPTSSR